MSANIMEELSRQVERVSTIREHYRREGDRARKLFLPANFEPAIHLMSAAIEAAHKAAAGGDIIEIARAIVGTPKVTMLSVNLSEFN